MVSLTLWKKKTTFISGLYSMTRCFKRFSLFSHFIIVIKKKNWKHGNLKAIPLVHLAHSYGVLKHRLSSTFLRICSGLPRLNLAYYDQTPSQSTLMSTQLSLIMQDRSCSLKLSLFPPSQISVGPNSGSLWRVIGERAHWFGGLGEGHVWTHRREGEGARERGHVWHVCMYGGWLGSAASLRNPPKTSTHFLCWCWRCSALLVCVLFRVQTSVMASLKLLKSGNVVLAQIFPPPDQTLWCQFWNVEWLTVGILWVGEPTVENKPPRVHCR